MLFSWRKHTRGGERAAPASSSISFTPVVIAPPEPSPPPSPQLQSAPLIELEFGAAFSFGSLGCRSGFVAAVIKAMPRR